MHYPSVIPTVYYQDPRAALAWLERAFGFETRMLLDGPGGDDRYIHSEMNVGSGGLIFVGGEWSEATRSPKSLDGRYTATMSVILAEDIDAHCERARAAGAVITAEPKDQFYGHRSYNARDPEGHIWAFEQPILANSVDEPADAAGVTIRTSLM